MKMRGVPTFYDKKGGADRKSLKIAINLKHKNQCIK